MLITIVNVDVTNTPAKGKGRPWSTAEVTYKNERGEVKAWKVISFANPQTFDVLKNAVNGEQYEITTGKNEKDFTVWTSAQKADGSVASNSSVVSAKPAGKVLGSTYETAEERAARQRLIVRQSSLAQAIEFAKLVPGVLDWQRDDILELAGQFTAWVFEQPDLFDQPNDLPE